MTLTSDLTLDATKFHSDSVPNDVKKLNTALEKITAAGPHWYQVGIAKYREMRENGETSFPPTVYLEEARDTQIPSREAGRNIPLRVYMPDNGQPSKGIFLHFHGGGFIIGSHRQFVFSFLTVPVTC
jgi:acetyl esterase/lipase